MNGEGSNSISKVVPLNSFRKLSKNLNFERPIFQNFTTTNTPNPVVRHIKEKAKNTENLNQNNGYEEGIFDTKFSKIQKKNHNEINSMFGKFIA